VTTSDNEVRTFGDRYVLGDRLTTGEGSEVWQAHDDVVGRSVALKIFFGSRAGDPSWRKGFRHTAGRLAALSHPGIAKVHESGESDAEAWLAMAFVAGGQQLSAHHAAAGLSPAAALNIVGQTAIALKAAHDVGVIHGDLTAANLLIRPGNVIAVVGFSFDPAATRAGDLTALGELAHELLGDRLATSPDLPAEVDDFVGALTDPDRPTPPTDAGDIGRTALALAASLSGGHATTVTPRAKPLSAMDETPDAEPRYDQADRRRVRNKLIALGAIVVVFGAALIFFIGQGGGHGTVPNVVNLPLPQAQDDLIQQGFHDNQTTVVGSQNSAGTVVSQSPPAGVRAKLGSTVTLTIAVDGAQ
jgi:serine/threonine protein kinase